MAAAKRGSSKCAGSARRVPPRPPPGDMPCPVGDRGFPTSEIEPQDVRVLRQPPAVTAKRIDDLGIHDPRLQIVAGLRHPAGKHSRAGSGRCHFGQTLLLGPTSHLEHAVGQPGQPSNTRILWDCGTLRRGVVTMPKWLDLACCSSNPTLPQPPSRTSRWPVADISAYFCTMRSAILASWKMVSLSWMPLNVERMCSTSSRSIPYR